MVPSVLAHFELLLHFFCSSVQNKPVVASEHSEPPQLQGALFSSLPSVREHGGNLPQLSFDFVQNIPVVSALVHSADPQWHRALFATAPSVFAHVGKSLQLFFDLVQNSPLKQYVEPQ